MRNSGAVSSSSPQVAYLFSSGRKMRLGNQGPTEFFYGFPELVSLGTEVELFEEDDIGAGEWSRIPEALSRRVVALTGASPRLMWRLYKALKGPLKSFDVIIATQQSLGFSLAALGALGLHRKKTVVLTMGMLEPGTSAFVRGIRRWLLRGATLATLSKPEAEYLRSWLPASIPVLDFTFGVDLNFWTPSMKETSGSEIISIGNDRARDFDTLVSAWSPDFPPLTIITSRKVANTKPNIAIEQGDWRGAHISDEALKERLQRARLIIVPVIDTIQPSGQSATLQAMACGRPVILSANKGLWDNELLGSGICYLVPPADPAALQKKLAHVLADREGAESVGRAARVALEENDISTLAMAKQIADIALMPRATGEAD